MTFRHAGKLGDIVCSLPVVRHLGGGDFYIESAAWCEVQLTPDKWCGIDKLLLAQPYINSVQFWNATRPACDANLNDFRDRMVKSFQRRTGFDVCLTDWMADTFGVPRTVKDAAWLEVEPKRVARVVFNRAGPGRPNHIPWYFNKQFPWHKVWQKYRKEAVFIGTQTEYDHFCATCGAVPRYPSKDIFEAAQIIAGCDLFVGNQSCCHTIAEGLKKRILLEVWPQGPNVLFFREGVTHGWRYDVELPDLN